MASIWRIDLDRKPAVITKLSAHRVICNYGNVMMAREKDQRFKGESEEQHHERILDCINPFRKSEMEETMIIWLFGPDQRRRLEASVQFGVCY